MIKKYQKRGKKLEFKNYLGKFGLLNVIIVGNLFST